MTSKVDEESLLLEAPSTSKSFKSYAAPKVAGAFVVALCLGALAAATVSSSPAVEPVRKEPTSTSRRRARNRGRQAFKTAVREAQIADADSAAPHRLALP